MNLGQVIEFTVLGIPRPQGSMKGMVSKSTGRVILKTDNANMKSWRQEVGWAALQARCALGIAEPCGRNVAIRLEAHFFFPRPKSDKSIEKTKKPDVSKLLRCAEDAMTGIIYTDDSQIVEAHIFKSFGQPARAEIKIQELLPPMKEFNRAKWIEPAF